MKKKTATHLTHSGSNPKAYHGVVNVPPHRASTIVFERCNDFWNGAKKPFSYARNGTPSSAAFEEAIAGLEGASGSVSTCSGLSAITVALFSTLKSGDHVLIPDNVYGPTRRFCMEFLAAQNIETTFYPPLINANIRHLFKKNTKVLFIEAPGSVTFEVPDIAALVRAAKKKRITTIMDNSWATPLYFKPLEHGIDISVMSATKYITGHSDAMLGIVSGTARTYPLLKKSALALGLCAGSEELYMGLRGLRTLHVRMKEHHTRGIELARWLKHQPGVKHVLHPAFDELGKKYFSGFSSTFGLELKTTDKKKYAQAVDALKLFRIGASWGGYESLCFPQQPQRTTEMHDKHGMFLRLHVGFEDMEDLQADLARALKLL